MFAPHNALHATLAVISTKQQTTLTSQ